MQTVKDLTAAQIIDYSWIDSIERNLNIQNEGGYHHVSINIQMALDYSETIEDYKAHLIMIENSLESHRANVQKVNDLLSKFKCNIINRQNHTDKYIKENDLELLTKLQQKG